MNSPNPSIVRPVRPGDPSPDSVRYRQRMGAAAPRHREDRPRLEVVPPHERRSRLRRMRRRLLAGVGVLVALAVVFGLVLVHVELTANQLRLTSLQDQAQRAEVENGTLRLQVATLQSPARIVAKATQLGMVTPQVIDYLSAVAGATGTPAAASAAPTSSPAPSSPLSGWVAVKHADTGP